MYGKGTMKRGRILPAASLAAVLLTAAFASFGVTEARAGLPAPPGLPPLPGLNVKVSGGVPALPGVQIAGEDQGGYKNEGRKLGHKKHKKHNKHNKHNKHR